MKVRAAALVPLLLTVLSLRFHRGALASVDVGFDDETVYLEGTHALANDSPLYPRFYGLLALVAKDPVDRYLLGWFVLSAALPLVAYALARRSGAGVVGALVVALVQLFSHTSETWPRVGAFAALTLGVGALGVTYLPARRRALAAACGAAVVSLTSFARPELAFPAIGLAIYAGVLGRRERLTAAIAIAAGLAPVALTGGRNDGGRSFFAFLQHYAYNVALTRSDVGDPWNGFVPVARAAFPKAESIAGAALENPARFAWHLGQNAQRVPVALWKLASPVGYAPLLVATALVLACSAVIVAGLARRREVDPRLRAWTPLVVAVLVGTLAAVLVIHPRQHYLLPVTFLALPLAAAAARDTLDPRGAIAVVALLFLVPTKCGGAFEIGSARRWSQCAALEERSTIAALRRLELPPRVVILEPDYSRGVYLGRPFEHVALRDKHAPIGALLRDRGVDVVVLNQRARQQPSYLDDAALRRFDEGGDEPGLRRVEVPGTDVVLGVRR